jgi:parallel beta-helix repeat protein
VHASIICTDVGALRALCSAFQAKLYEKEKTRMVLKPRARAACAALGSAVLAAAFMGIGAGSAAAATSALRVGCGHGAYPTISAAVSAASSGDTIVVCPGTYPGGIVIPANTPLSIVGIGHPVIDATNQDNGVQVLASGSRVQGFTVENAIGEGILVGNETMRSSPVSDVTIRGNTVENNDLGNPNGASLANSPYPQCNAANNVPGDCGEGIHLVNAFDNTVVGNRSTGNSGGILIDDDTGPSYDNLIESNVVSGNVFDCGITVASHTPEVFGGGVHDNTIRGNWVTNNGVKGQGGGVLLATGVPGFITGIPGTGGAVYDNTVEGNYLAGNGLGGVTLHSHSPGENLDGNVVSGNLIGRNNLTPDEDFGPQFKVPDPTGVIVTAVSNVSITIEHNVIFDDVNGIDFGQVGSTITVNGVAANLFTGASNLFFGVQNPVVTVP